MDDICKVIKTQYPINYTVLQNGGRPISLKLADGLPEAVCLSIQAAMNRFMLPIDDDAELAAELCLETCPDTQEPCLTLHCGNHCFYLPEDDPGITLAWTLYALSQDLPFLNTPHPRKLLAVEYSAEQQSAAASLLATVEYWGSEPETEELKELVQKVVSESVDELSAHAPLFSGRPVTAEGWRLLQKTRGFFARKHEWELQELSNALFGQRSYMTDLNAFSSELSDQSSFYEMLSEIVRTLAEELYTCPMTNLDMRLGEVIRVRQEELKKTETSIKKAVKAELAKKTLLRAVDPRTCFESIDSGCGRLASAKIESRILDQVQKHLPKTLEHTLTAAQKGIWDWRRSLQSFCRVEPSENRLPLSWDCFALLRTVLPQSESANWDGRMMQTLKMNAGTHGRYIRAAWFCAPPLCDLSEIDYNITYPVMMTGQAVVALMEDLLEEAEIHE